MGNMRKGQMVFEYKLGGPESSAPSWDASYTVFTCDVLRYADNNQSVTIDDTLVCDTLVQDVGVRADRTIDIQAVVRSAKLLFGTAVNQHITWRVTIPTDATSTVETLVGVIRKNNRSAEGDNRILQDISIRVKSITSYTGPA